ncbi:MAG: tRNA lysidine(34) synthetase TilS [Cryomorphaceae bacterium]|nr:tRNA lysidine(34) synthetase TilS [Cryomorphaceae bacterium]
MNRRPITEIFSRADVHPDHRLLIACSGGVDSVVLTQIIKEMHFEAGLAHVNYHKRGIESEKDAQFVEKLAEEMGMEFHHIDYKENNGGNFQRNARDFRYQWFAHIAKTHGYNWICTAHHADDQRETILQKILRGAGAQSLQGIRAIHGKTLRPLIAMDKAEILQFAKENQLQWREDTSNFTIDYERNYIRNILLPHFKAHHPRGLKGYDLTMQRLQNQAGKIEDLLQIWRQRCLTEVPGAWEIAPEIIPTEAYRADWLAEILLPWGKFDVPMILEKSENGISASSNYGNYVLSTSLARIFLHREKFDEDVVDLPFTSEEISLGNAQKIICQDNPGAFDRLYVKNTNNMTYSRPRPGDKICLNNGLHKKVSDFLLEQRIPAILRKTAIWIIRQNNEIIWIPGLYKHPDHFKTNKDEMSIMAFLSPAF